MATLYYATGGPSWTYNQNWLTDKDECCQWYQDQGSIENVCGENGTALQSLLQGGNVLNGTLPDEIGLLTSLTFLNLKRNMISGTVPSIIGSLTALTHLSLCYNAFTGTVPSQLGSLTALKRLSLYNNAFQGTLTVRTRVLDSVDRAFTWS
jgi:hypothetical protein